MTCKCGLLCLGCKFARLVCVYCEPRWARSTFGTPGTLQSPFTVVHVPVRSPQILLLCARLAEHVSLPPCALLAHSHKIWPPSRTRKYVSSADVLGAILALIGHFSLRPQVLLLLFLAFLLPFLRESIVVVVKTKAPQPGSVCAPVLKKFMNCAMFPKRFLGKFGHRLYQ